MDTSLSVDSGWPIEQDDCIRWHDDSDVIDCSLMLISPLLLLHCLKERQPNQKGSEPAFVASRRQNIPYLLLGALSFEMLIRLRTLVYALKSGMWTPSSLVSFFKSFAGAPRVRRGTITSFTSIVSTLYHLWRDHV